MIGGGGREHAICAKLAENPRIGQLYCLPGNGGIASVAECIEIGAADIDGIVSFALGRNIDFAVVSPDDPLAMGCVDRLNAAGIRAFGPTAAAARIESSKVFAKELMRRHGIPTAQWRAFSDLEEALAYARSAEPPLVVKCDGLALGKGVIVADTREQAEAAIRSMLEDGAFSDAGRRIVVEEYMEGREVTVLAFCDGTSLMPMPPSRDHKRAFDGDLGPNTGGMGAYSPVRDYTPEIAARCMDEIFLPTVRAMRAEGCPFKGVLYFGLMLTPAGPKVVEYNARFGDPEAQTVLSLLETDLLDIFMAVEEERLGAMEIAWSGLSAATVVVASSGYPGSYGKGFEISGLDRCEGSTVYHAGTRASEGRCLTSGGRVLAVTATGRTLSEALGKAYADAGRIAFEGAWYRRDIGRSEAAEG